MRNLLHSPRTLSGFSLIEAMVTLVVLSVGMIGIASLYGQGLGAGRTALYRTQAVNLAADMADRIRVNRMGAASYGGAAANNNCDPAGGGGVNCTPAQMAAHDLFLWTASVAATLPNGAGTVAFAAGTPPSFTINVTWQEVGIGPITHTVVVQIPQFLSFGGHPKMPINKHLVLRTRPAQAGVTLIELMVAMAIGAFLMIGAITVFMQSRTTFRVTESVSRLQENARFALDALEPDIRMARYWGLTTRTTKIANRAAQTAANGIGADTCGVNWLIDLDNHVEARNNAYAFGCAASNGGAVANSDTLVVRHAAEDAATVLVNGRMYIQTGRFQDGRIFNNGVIPAGFTAADSESHELIVNGYYVARNSSLGVGTPSLNRKWLRQDGTIVNEEIMAGVEDMQVQFGVDTDVIGAANRGSIDRYINAGDPILTIGNPAYLPDAEILAVRIWLRLRAERVENGFTDTATYVYADRNVAALNDGFRRLVVSKTIYLRNARPAS